MRLVNADGRGLASVGITTMKVQLNNLEATQTFIAYQCQLFLTVISWLGMG